MKPSLLNKTELDNLYKALHFMRMEDLREACDNLQLPSYGLKGALIERIMTFIKTGTIASSKDFPTKSKAVKTQSYPLKSNTRILFGSYKNDLATRLFMKKLVGEHFHFTAFGHDWIKNLWAQEKPPTYAEFADFWQQEYDRRKKQKAAPKKEWAYIIFVQGYTQHHQNASRLEIMNAWKQQRDEQTAVAKKLLLLILKKLNKP